MVASAAMIAQQVAGKAARDALFLSHFPVSALPIMMAVSAMLSVAAVLWLARMMVRYSPARVVPAGFALGGVALLLEWALSFPAPRAAALVLYLHTAVYGAVMISAFWSLINETFDPHTGKRAVTSIAAGGTLGGVLGGVIAWRASSAIAVPTMLPLLASMNVLSFWGTYRRGPRAALPPKQELAEPDGLSALSPLRVMGSAPYLRNLAWVVALGAVTSGLLDYVFSAEAAKRFDTGPKLLSFFSLFWLVVGVVSFVLQSLFGRMALEKLGLAVTVAILPGVVVLGGALGLVVPGLGSTAILRGAEATQRNSLFRAAYELLYTPLSEQRKRSAKMLIDVGCDRLGTVVAGALTLVALALRPKDAETILILLAVACAMATLTRSRGLHRGYVSLLEERLREKSEEGAVFTEDDTRPSRESGMARDRIVEQLDALPDVQVLAAAVGNDDVLAADAARLRARPPETRDDLAQALRAAVDLCSGNPKRIRRVLSADGPLPPAAVPFAIALLADDGARADAIRALRKSATRITGQLVDALCDPDQDFEVRRRVPRVLSESSTQLATDGLLRGAKDERFEVRYACGRALLKIATCHAGTVVAQESVVSLVQREVRRSKEIWESQGTAGVDEDEYETAPLFVRLLRDRVDRSLEHVFNLLALLVDPESLQIAFKALHHDDVAVRGTALEYLENVLPDEIREAVWPFLGEERPMRPARATDQILADLVRARSVVSAAAAIPSKVIP